METIIPIIQISVYRVINCRGHETYKYKSYVVGFIEKYSYLVIAKFKVMVRMPNPRYDAYSFIFWATLTFDREICEAFQFQPDKNFGRLGGPLGPTTISNFFRGGSPAPFKDVARPYGTGIVRYLASSPNKYNHNAEERARPAWVNPKNVTRFQPKE